MSKFQGYRASVMAGTALLALAVTASAHAQVADAAAPDAPQASAGAAQEGAIADIVVTANKREQSINKVGLAITALSGDALRNQRVVSLDDLAKTIPGLSYAPSATQTPVYTLRGVGFYESSLAAYPTTSVYVDQVPLPFPALTTHSNFDLERVEVLKGPQGTLFGQNSTGGAINFIAAKPTSELAAGADLTYGRFNRVEGNAFISGPLSDTVRVRVAVTGARADDWQYSYTRKDKLGEVGYYAGRILVDWAPSSRLDFQLNLNAWRDQSDPQAPQYQTLLSQSPATTFQTLRDFPFSPFKPRAADWTPSTRPHADNKMFQGSLRANWNLTDDVTLTSISSYAHYKPDQGFETDGTTLMADDFIVDRGKIKSFNQELRLANRGNAQLRWVVGANYEKSHVYEYQLQTFSDISTAAVFGYTGAYVYSDQHMRNYAFFANTEYDITDRITVKGGAR